MMPRKIQLSVTMCCALATVFTAVITADAQAEDWLHKSFKVTGGGSISFEFPESWGKKPRYEADESIAEILFGPHGPKSKPLFSVRILSAVAVDPVSAAALMETTEVEVEKFRNTAFETDIPISSFSGPNVTAHYFSITDQESRRGEYDYLTMAVISSGHLLVKVYFLSSDGAPDFGADAMRMMQSIKYTAPEPGKK